MTGRLRSLKGRMDSVELPKGAVAALCAAILALPAGLAMGHSAKLDSQGRWVHHHTTNYTACNHIDQDTNLKNEASNARAFWNAAGTPLSFPAWTECHPASGEQVHIQLQDGHHGNTGWRSSAIDDSAGFNLGYHVAHTHIHFNLDSYWGAYGNYDRRALVCREIGQVIGVERVWSSQYAAHGQANDCMSFAANPADQVSKIENGNNYTYTDRPSSHSIDLLETKYESHVVEMSLTGGFDEDSDYYDVDLLASTTLAATDPAGLMTASIKVDGVEVFIDEVSCSPGALCELDSPWEISTETWSAGSHSIEAAVTNPLGITQSRTITVVAPLNTTIETGPFGISRSGSASVTFSSPSSSSFQCKLDAGAWVVCSSPWSLGPLSEGGHEVLVRASGFSGVDPTPAKRDWIVDTLAPDTSITSSPSPSSTSTAATVAFGSSGATSGFECRWDSEDWSPCASPSTRGDLLIGSHSFTVRAEGPSGHKDPKPESVAWEVLASSLADGCESAPSAQTESAIGTLEAHHPEVLAPSIPAEWEGEEIDPTLEPVDAVDGLESEGSLATSLTPCELEDGVRLDTSWGVLTMDPVGVDLDASGATTVNGDTAVFSETATDTDTVIRPTAQGVASVAQIRTGAASETLAWRLSMPGGVHARLMDNGSVAVVPDTSPIIADPVHPGTEEPIWPSDPLSESVLLNTAEIPPGADGMPLVGDDYSAADDPSPMAAAPERADSVPDVTQQLQVASDALEHADAELQSEGPADDYLLATIDRPWAVDAEGDPVPAAFSVTGDVVTMTVEHRAGDTEYPVIADPDLIDCRHRPSPCGTFRPDAAATYAGKWRTSRNRYSYPQFSSHCTGFASEVLKAGNMRYMREPRKGQGSWWALYSARPRPLGPDWTHSWSFSGVLKDHLLEYDLARRIPDGQRNYRPGDIVFWRWREGHKEGLPGDFDHTTVVYSVVNNGKKPYMLQHDQDHHEPFTLRTFRRRADDVGISRQVHLRPIHTRANIAG